MPHIWFTADTHYQHKNIIGYTNRPFTNSDEMDNKLIHNHNQLVKKNDTVFFLGDFCFRGGKQGGKKNANYYINRLNGNYTFIKGNHDNRDNCPALIEYACINYLKYHILLVHNPADASPMYPINLCGHVHQNWRTKEIGNNSLIINVGVDANNYKPISIGNVIRIYKDFLKAKKHGNKNKTNERSK